MKSKSIWIINQYAGSPIHGMEYRHYYMARALVQQGHSVTIISGSYSHLFTRQPGVSQTFTYEKLDGINYCWVKIPSYKKSTSMGRIWNMLVFAFRIFFMPVKNLDKPDAILVSSPSLFPVLFGKRVAKKYNAKFIFEVRDIWPLTLQELGSFSSLHPLIVFMQWFENYGYKNADKVVSVLPGAYLHMESKGMIKEKFSYIPNGINLPDSNTTSVNRLEILPGIPTEKFIVGYAGSMGVSNALDYLIDAAEILKSHNEIVFVLMGKGEAKEKLMEKAKELANVIFLDAITKDKVADVIARFDVCHIGWKKEELYRFGVSANKLYEYMLAAKPIIQPSGAYNDPVTEAKCGLSIEPESGDAIAQAILKLKQLSSEERKIMGENGRNFVLQNHRYEQLAQKLLSLI